MESQERGGLQIDGVFDQSAWMDQNCPDPHQNAVHNSEGGSSFPGTVENQELVFQKKRFGEDGLCPARPEEAENRSDKVHEEKE